jgi:Protein of unknown function (DUF2924)
VPRARIEHEIERLQSLDLPALRGEWRRLHHGAPPRLSRDLFVLALGYRLQEIERGGVSKSMRRKLETAAKSLPAKGEQRPVASPCLKPGARLIREWGGRSHCLTATENGFIYDGAAYPSLTAIARTITGARWSGPRFFGLKAAKPAPSRLDQGNG